MKPHNTLHILFVLLLYFSGNAFAQYQVKNLGDHINSEYEELSPILSGNGQKLFFVRVNHPENKYGTKRSQDIWMAEKDESGNWKMAERLPDRVNITRYNAVLWANETGDEILISGIYDKKGKNWIERGMSRIAYSNGKWSRPVPVEIKGFKNLNEGKLTTISLSENETVLVLSFSKMVNGKKSDIFLSIKKGKKYSKPKKLKDVSSKYDDQAPYINPAHDAIYFSSNRSTSGNDNYDIFKSEKIGSSWKEWSDPQPVDLGINSSGYESYFKLVNEGKSALFVSTENSIGNSDIFEVVIEEEEPEKMTITGIINEASTDKLLPYTNFDLIVNEVPVEYIMKKPDSIAFEFNIEAQDTLRVTARVSGFRVDTVLFKSSDIGVNLYDVSLTAERITYEKAPEPFQVTISGGIYEKERGVLLPSDVTPLFLINDLAVDSLDYDTYTGAYKLYFTTLDSALVLRVNAKGYLPYSKALKVDYSSQLNHDIYLNKKQQKVTVFGKILNAKTQSPVDSLKGVEIIVNGKVAQNVTFLPEESSYQLFVSKDSLYAIEAHLSGYFGISDKIDLRGQTIDRVEKDLLLSPVEVGQSVKLDNIFFKSGSSELLQESIPELNKVADFLRENKSIVIEIAGYTDNVGSDTFNQKLSEERAKSVARYIILKGFSRDRIEFKGYGEENPIATNDTPEGREQNRRVEFKVLRN